MTKTLAKEHGRLTATKLGPVYTINDSLSNGYRQLVAGAGIFVSEAYFDMGGMTVEDETLFFDGAAVQDIQNAFSDSATVGDNATIVDLMTTKPVSDTDLQNYIVFANMIGPTNLTFDQVIYGRIRFQNTDVDNVAGSVMITLSDFQTGSLEPTASDRIYTYRIVTFGSGNSDGTYFTLACRHLLRATAKEEPEYEYLMRLKRSYELQNQPDRD